MVFGAFIVSINNKWNVLYILDMTIMPRFPKTRKNVIGIKARVCIESKSL
jgi:hypothetical protein